MKNWIINHKNESQLLAAVLGAIISLTAAVLICGSDNAPQAIELIGEAQD